MKLFSAFALVLASSLLTFSACPAPGDCAIDDDCEDGFACREDAGGENVCIQLAVEPPPPPEEDPVAINSFTASETNVDGGASVTLTWASENATSCALSGIGNVELSGSETVVVDDTTLFTLICQGQEGPAFEELTVAVNPVITSFSLTPSEANALEDVTITWQSSGTESCGITAFGRDIPGTRESNGSVVVAAEASSSIVLTCEGAQNVSETQELSVAQISSFDATPVVLAASQTTELSWEIDNVSNCAVSDLDDADTSDQIASATPTLTTLFTLVCTGYRDVEIQRSTEVVVLIENFEAQSAVIASGEDAVFNVQISNRAQSCSFSSAGLPDQDVAIDASTVSVPAAIATLSGTLTCFAQEGSATSESVTIEVE